MICKVCGRKPERYDSLCFGVHADCSDALQLEQVGLLFQVRNARWPESVWYCSSNGMRVIEEGAPQ